MSETFGERLKDLRSERCLTISYVAKAVGISHGALTDYENGKEGPAGEPKAPSCVTFQKLANFYGVSYDWLYGENLSRKWENVDISRQLGLSERAIEQLKAGVEASKQPLCEWLNYAKTLSLLLEDKKFCDAFFSNAYHYFNRDSHLFAAKAIADAGIMTETTDGSQMFLLGILQAFTVLQEQLNKEGCDKEHAAQIKRLRQN